MVFGDPQKVSCGFSLLRFPKSLCGEDRLQQSTLGHLYGQPPCVAVSRDVEQVERLLGAISELTLEDHTSWGCLVVRVFAQH